MRKSSPSKIMRAFLMSLVMVMFACADIAIEEPIGADDKEPGPATLTYRSQEQAEEEVFAIIDELYQQTRGEFSRPTISDRKVVFNTPATRSGEATDQEAGEQEPLIYVFNFEDDQGFALIAAREDVSPVLAITESGNFDPDEPIENPGFGMFMDMAYQYLETTAAQPAIVGGGLPPFIPPGPNDPGPEIPVQPDPNYPVGPYDYMYSSTAWTTTATYGHKIPVTWDQGDTNDNANTVYNRYCPMDGEFRSYAGCSAVAIAQIMAYHNWPTKYGSYTFNWGLMKANRDAGELSTTGQDMVARLLQQLGTKNNIAMEYGSEGSSGAVKNYNRTFNNFGYTADKPVSYTYNNLKYYLNTAGPCLMIGYRHETKDGITKLSGHVWVIDQVMIRSRTNKTYYKGQLIESRTETQELVHQNWGWDGKNNGYFYQNVFDIHNRVITDHNIVHVKEKRNYLYNLEIIRNIKKK